MAEITSVSEATFTQEVLRSPLPVLVDYSAPWCGPCKMLDPVVKQLAVEWSGKIKVFKVDIDQNPGLVTNYQIMSVPTLMLFVNGKLVERTTGYQPKDKLEKKFKPHLSA